MKVLISYAMLFKYKYFKSKKTKLLKKSLPHMILRLAAFFLARFKYKQIKTKVKNWPVQ